MLQRVQAKGDECGGFGVAVDPEHAALLVESIRVHPIGRDHRRSLSAVAQMVTFVTKCEGYAISAAD
jgi:hypothetical protein